MAISFIGSVYAESTGVTPPTHQAGDLFVCFAYRDGNATAPTLPSGWTNMNSAGANTNAFRLGYKIATTSSDTCTGWTNASGVILHVYRGAGAIGGMNFTSASNASITYPALLTAGFTNKTGTSWAAAFAGHRSTNTTTIGNAPGGMTNRGTLLGVNSDYASHDTDGNSNLFNSSAVATGGTASGYYAVVAEVMNAQAAVLTTPNVTQVSSTSGTPRVTTDWPTGNIYMVVVPDGDTPSVAQIKAGQRSNGTAAITSQNKTVTIGGQQTFTNVTGLTAGTEYDFWFVHTNAYGDSSAVKADFKPIQYVSMDTGWRNPGAIASGSGFANAIAVTVEDGNYASGSGSYQPSVYPYNYGFNIPSDAQILGMEVRFKAYISSTGGSFAKQWYSQVYSDVFTGDAYTTNQPVVSTTTTTPAFYTVGSTSGYPTTTWGGWGGAGTPSISTINSQNFGCYFRWQNSDNFTGYVDVVQMRFTYQRPLSTATLSSPAVGYLSGTSGTPQVTSDWPQGTLYMVVVPDGDTPSVAQIKAGQRSNGTSAIAASNQAVTSVGVQTLASITGLEEFTNYDVWFTQNNDAGDSTAVKVDFRPVTRYDTGWVYPGAIAQPVGILFNATYSSTNWDRSWTNPSNAAAEDATYATVSSGGSSYSLARPLVGHNFGLSVPSNATIQGIEVQVSARASDNFDGSTSLLGTPAFVLNKDLVARTSDGWLVGNSLDEVKGVHKETTLTTSATPAPVNWGSPTDKWSGIAPYQLTGTSPNQYYVHGTERAISPSDLNSSDFGLAFKAGDGLANSFYLTSSVDYMKIKVYYTIEPEPPAPTSNPPVLFWAFP